MKKIFLVLFVSAVTATALAQENKKGGPIEFKPLKPFRPYNKLRLFVPINIEIPVLVIRENLNDAVKIPCFVPSLSEVEKIPVALLDYIPEDKMPNACGVVVHRPFK